MRCSCFQSTESIGDGTTVRHGQQVDLVTRLGQDLPCVIVEMLNSVNIANRCKTCGSESNSLSQCHT